MFANYTNCRSLTGRSCIESIAKQLFPNLSSLLVSVLRDFHLRSWEELPCIVMEPFPPLSLFCSPWLFISLSFSLSICFDVARWWMRHDNKETSFAWLIVPGRRVRTLPQWFNSLQPIRFWNTGDSYCSPLPRIWKFRFSRSTKRSWIRWHIYVSIICYLGSSWSLCWILYMYKFNC